MDPRSAGVYVEDRVIGATVALYCDQGHRRSYVFDLVRFADGHIRESGFVHQYPNVWVPDTSRSLRRRGVGEKDPVTGLHEWYENPSEGTIRHLADEHGLIATCSSCSLSLTKDRSPVPWSVLTPLLDRAVAGGVSRLSVNYIRSII